MVQVSTGCFAATKSGVGQPESIRVVSWNVNRGCRLQDIVDYLEAAKGDLILLQETDWHARRSGYRNVAVDIAAKLGMYYVFGCEFQELSQGSPAAAAYHGQATLSRWPLLHVRILRFRRQSGFWRPRWYVPPVSVFERRLGGRIALVCQVSMPQFRLLTYNLHLESRGDDDLRTRQLDEVLEDTRQFGLDAPVLIAGDFNFDLRQPRAAEAISGMRFENALNGATRPLITARSRLGLGRSIDFILTKGLMTAGNAIIESSVAASDHFPITVTLRLK